MPSAPRDVGVFANSPAISKLVAKIQNPCNNRPDHLAIKITKKSGLGNQESMGWLVTVVSYQNESCLFALSLLRNMVEKLMHSDLKKN